MANLEDLGGPRRMVIDADTRRVVQIQGKRMLSIYVTGSLDTISEQKSFIRNAGPVLADKARELGVGFRITGTWDWHTGDRYQKPTNYIVDALQAIAQSNFFVAIVGNHYGWAKSKRHCNFQHCFREAAKNFTWLSEHILTPHLSFLELEIDFAMRESSRDRGSGNMHQLFFSLTPQAPRPGFETQIEEELQIALKRTVRGSGWHAQAHSEMHLARAVIAAIKQEFGEHKPRTNINFSPFLNEKLLYFNVETSTPVDLVQRHVDQFPGKPLVILGPPGVGKSTIVAGWLKDEMADTTNPPLVYYETISEGQTIDQVMMRVVQFIAEFYGVKFVFGGSQGGGKLSPRRELVELFHSFLAISAEGYRRFILVLENVHNLAEAGVTHFLRKNASEAPKFGKQLETPPVVILTGHYEWYAAQFGESGHDEEYDFKLLYNSESAYLHDTAQEQFLDTFLVFYYKKISKADREIVLDHPMCKNPMFLRLVCDLLLDCASPVEVKSQLKLLDRVESFHGLYRRLLIQIQARLAKFVGNDDNRAEVAQKTLTSCLKLIWASPDGATDLQITEFCELTGMQTCVLLQLLSRLTVRFDGAIYFAHSTFSDFVRDEYVPHASSQSELHIAVADFKLKLLFGSAVASASACMAAATQLFAACAWERLVELTLDLKFLAVVLPQRQRDVRYLWDRAQPHVTMDIKQELTKRLSEATVPSKSHAHAYALLVLWYLEAYAYYDALKIHTLAQPVVRAVADDSATDDLNVFGLQIRQRLQTEDAESFCDEVLEFYEDKPPSLGRILVHQTRGILLFESGQVEAASHEFKECIKLAKRLEAARVEGQSLRDCAMACKQHDRALSRELLYSAAEMARSHRDRLLLVSVCYTQAVHAFEAHLFEECEVAVDRCLTIARQVCDGQFIAWATTLGALTMLHKKQGAQARSRFQDAMILAKHHHVTRSLDMAVRATVLSELPKLGKGELPHSVPNNIGPQGFRDVIMPPKRNINIGVEFAENHRLLAEQMDKLASAEPFYGQILSTPKPKTVAFVDALAPVFSCRPQDLLVFLKAGSLKSCAARADEESIRQGVRDFVTSHIASIINSWKVDNAGGDLLIDHVENMLIKELGPSQASTARHQALARFVEEMHKNVFQTAPERIAAKQFARIDAAAARVSKKAKREGLETTFPFNMWGRELVQQFDYDQTCWSVLGPNVQHGSVAIILNKDILQHEDTYLTPNSNLHHFSGNTRILRPWGVDLPLFDAATLRTAPQVQDKASSKRETHASMNAADMKRYFADPQVQTKLTQQKLSATIEGWKELLARDIRGQANMFHQTRKRGDPRLSYKLLEEWYLLTDHNHRVECQLPPEVSLSFVSVIVVAKSAVPKGFIAEIENTKLPDGRCIKDVLVVVDTVEDSLQWQREFFLCSWEFTTVHDRDFDKLVPRIGERLDKVDVIVDEEFGSRCFGRRRRSSLDLKKLDEALKRENEVAKEEEAREAVIKAHENVLQGTKDSRNLMQNLLLLFGGGS